MEQINSVLRGDKLWLRKSHGKPMEDSETLTPEESEIQWKNKLQYVPCYWEWEKKTSTNYSAPNKYKADFNHKRSFMVCFFQYSFITESFQVAILSPYWRKNKTKTNQTKKIKLPLRIKAARTVTVVFNPHPASNRFSPSLLVLLEQFHFLVKLDTHFWKKQAVFALGSIQGE